MNPYSTSGPVSNSNVFYGYRDELDTIVENGVASQTRLSFMVVGGRMMGKSSLLLQAEQRLRSINAIRTSGDNQPFIISIYLDMCRLDSTNFNVFLCKIARLLNRHLEHTPIPFFVPNRALTLLESISTSSNPHDTVDIFRDALYELIQAAYPTQLRVVLLIDDLWRVQHADIGAFTRNLRALYIEPSLENSLAYIITCSYHEFGEAYQPGSPLENILRYKELRVLNKNETMQIINEPTEGKIPLEIVQQVYIETGGHPFLIQYLMSKLCNHADWTQLLEEHIEYAEANFLREHRVFERWKEKLSDLDRHVYELFCQGEVITPSHLISKMLTTVAEKERRIQYIDRTLDSLRILSTTGLIRENDRGLYELAGQWPARWFRQLNRI
jgi:hypothetical protein